MDLQIITIDKLSDCLSVIAHVIAFVSVIIKLTPSVAHGKMWKVVRRILEVVALNDCKGGEKGCRKDIR